MFGLGGNMEENIEFSKEWLLDKINKLTFRENIKKTSEKIVIKKVDLYKLVLDVLLLNEECYDELL
jgi:hypothetical protein